MVGSETVVSEYSQSVLLLVVVQTCESPLCCYREVFHVVEDVLCVPKLTCVLPTCTLKVINNDTLEQTPHVFLKVAPHVYRKNSVCDSNIIEYH